MFFRFFLGENNVHSYIEFKDGKAILNPKVKKIKDLEPIKIQDATDYLTQKWAELGEKVKNELKYDEIRESALATDETIQSLSAYFLQPIPETLINFYKTVGGIESDETFSIFSVENLLNQIQERTNLKHNSTGIIDMIIAFWANDRPEFQEYKFLTEEQTQKINETFPCIGWMMSEEDINESGEYVIFDKNGNFANIYCHQDKIKSTVNQLLKLLETGLPERSLENVLEELFERAEGNLSRWD